MSLPEPAIKHSPVRDEEKALHAETGAVPQREGANLSCDSIHVDVLID